MSPGSEDLSRTDALRCHDGNAPRLPEKAEELFIASGLVLSNSRKVLVLIADEEDLAKIALPVRFHLWDAVEDSPLKIQIHHHA